MLPDVSTHADKVDPPYTKIYLFLDVTEPDVLDECVRIQPPAELFDDSAEVIDLRSDQRLDADPF